MFDDERKNLRLYVDDDAKAMALHQLMPIEKTFGNVVITISIIPANKFDTMAVTNNSDAFRALFKGNPIISDIITIDNFVSDNITYIIFEPDVVQYYDDNFQDAHGLHSTLYQEIAKEVFGYHDGIFFCTEKVDMDVTFRPWI